MLRCCKGYIRTVGCLIVAFTTVIELSFLSYYIFGYYSVSQKFDQALQKFENDKVGDSKRWSRDSYNISNDISTSNVENNHTIFLHEETKQMLRNEKLVMVDLSSKNYGSSIHPNHVYSISTKKKTSYVALNMTRNTPNNELKSLYLTPNSIIGLSITYLSILTCNLLLVYGIWRRKLYCFLPWMLLHAALMVETSLVLLFYVIYGGKSFVTYLATIIEENLQLKNSPAQSNQTSISVHSSSNIGLFTDDEGKNASFGVGININGHQGLNESASSNITQPTEGNQELHFSNEAFRASTFLGVILVTLFISASWLVVKDLLVVLFSEDPRLKLGKSNERANDSRDNFLEMQTVYQSSPRASYVTTLHENYRVHL